MESRWGEPERTMGREGGFHEEILADSLTDCAHAPMNGTTPRMAVRKTKRCQACFARIRAGRLLLTLLITHLPERENTISVLNANHASSRTYQLRRLAKKMYTTHTSDAAEGGLP